MATDNKKLTHALTGAGGSTSVGIAVAVWLTHDYSQPWTEVQTTAIGIGIGAVIAYGVLWLEILRLKLGGKPRNGENENA